MRNSLNGPCLQWGVAKEFNTPFKVVHICGGMTKDMFKLLDTTSNAHVRANLYNEGHYGGAPWRIQTVCNNSTWAIGTCVPKWQWFFMSNTTLLVVKLLESIGKVGQKREWFYLRMKIKAQILHHMIMVFESLQSDGKTVNLISLTKPW